MSGRKNGVEAALFTAVVLGASALLWGSLAVFGVPTISFVDDTRGPLWAIALFLLGGFTPSVAAVVLVAAREGRSGLKALLKSSVKVGLGWWYAVSIGIVALGTAGQLVINAALGHSFDFRLFLTQLPSFLPLIIIGPISEELGWRGYLLPRLQQKWGPALSSLAVGLVWGIWHLPLFFLVGTSQHELGLPFLGFLIGVVSTSVVMTWIMNNTGGSVWSAIFFHWIYTCVMQVTATGVTRTTTYNWLEYIPYLLIAVVVLLLQRSKRASVPHPAEAIG